MIRDEPALCGLHHHHERTWCKLLFGRRKGIADVRTEVARLKVGAKAKG
jgi:hypothetical protein